VPRLHCGASRGCLPWLTLAVMHQSRIDMPSFLIPLVIAGAILVPLGVLLWLGARERQRSLAMHDDDLGDLKVSRTYWETAAPQRIGQQALPISGVGGSTGPTPTQKATLDFVKANAEELSAMAVGAAKKAITATAADLQPDDLKVSGIFLHKEANCFELCLDSDSCAAAVPDGVAVSFAGKQIDEVELVH